MNSLQIEHRRISLDLLIAEEIMTADALNALLAVHCEAVTLSSLPMPDLWTLWDRFFKRRPDNPNRNYMESRVAYKLQEQEFGGLSRRIEAASAWTNR